jgi:hypothetical protein
MYGIAIDVKLILRNSKFYSKIRIIRSFGPTCWESERATSNESWCKYRIEETEDLDAFTKHMGFLEFAFAFENEKKDYFAAIS